MMDRRQSLEAAMVVVLWWEYYDESAMVRVRWWGCYDESTMNGHGNDEIGSTIRSIKE